MPGCGHDKIKLVLIAVAGSGLHYFVLARFGSI